MAKTIILIPSRLAATRLPNKPLLKINGLSIINHVYKKAKLTEIGDVCVATGDVEIFKDVTREGGKCILTREKHPTGTDRILEAYQNLKLNDVDYIINLQGDEPMIDIEDIRNLNNIAINNKSEIATLACEINDKKIFSKNNIVKVITKEEVSKDKITKAKNFLREVASLLLLEVAFVEFILVECNGEGSQGCLAGFGNHRCDDGRIDASGQIRTYGNIRTQS